MRRALVVASFGVMIVAALACLAWAQQTQPSDLNVVSFEPQEIERILQHSPLGPLPKSTNKFADDPRAARLGQFLFFDARLSANGKFACATCHDPQHAFTDGKPLAEGMGKAVRHAASLWNVAYNRWYFWDGRVDSLWSQSLKPIEHSVEMGGSRLQAAHVIHDDSALRRAYESIFGALPNLSDTSRFPLAGGPLDSNPDRVKAWTAMKPADQNAVNRVFANVGKAIEAYERNIITRHSPFDVFVEGLRQNDASKKAALSASAQRGLKLFVGSAECRLCHRGPNFSDGEFHDIGIPQRGGTTADPGRLDGIRLLRDDPFNAASEFSDDRSGPAAQQLEFLAAVPANFRQFKTPTLRNVAVTAPYMHQGQFATLAEVINYYSTLNGATFSDHHNETILRPREFSKSDAEDLIVFLQSLTDTDIDPSLMKKPDSPVLSNK